ncbi:putative membrane protein [Candidatus Protofrankia californiensis]|uniref:Putative membrane protein n=1 Tax=Candidatus Protofrankia californiensis TaxID=1839754 RepID=A0A1C3NYC1_9ACTN|nr:putative membrane protein [Candidatus Protofrankia californiensis]
MNGYGKQRRWTDKDGAIVEFYLYLVATFVTVRCLIQKAQARYRWRACRPPTPEVANPRLL